jgi:hypothetical protein
VLLHGIVVAFGAIFAIIGSPVFSFLYFASHDSLLGSGRSLGRAAVGQRLMTSDGEPVSHFVAASRNAVRWVMWATILPLIVDLALVLFGNGRIIADYIFDTRVYEDPLRVRQRFLASGLDEAALKRAREQAWDGEVNDEHLAEARREVEGVGEPDGEDHELKDFERRLTQQNAPVGGDPLAGLDDLGEVDLEAMRAELAAFEERFAASDVEVETHEHEVAVAEDAAVEAGAKEG